MPGKWNWRHSVFEYPNRFSQLVKRRGGFLFECIPEGLLHGIDALRLLSRNLLPDRTAQIGETLPQIPASPSVPRRNRCSAHRGIPSRLAGPGVLVAEAAAQTIARWFGTFLRRQDYRSGSVESGYRCFGGFYWSCRHRQSDDSVAVFGASNDPQPDGAVLPITQSLGKQTLFRSTDCKNSARRRAVMAKPVK